MSSCPIYGLRPVENTKEKVLPFLVGSLQRTLFKQTWGKTNSRPASLREQRNPWALKKCLTHRNSRLRPRGYREPNKTNPGRNKNQKRGLKGDASDLANCLILLFSEQTLWALQEDRANKNESAFNSQQKTSSAGTVICLREGWTANYKELK